MACRSCLRVVAVIVAFTVSACGNGEPEREPWVPGVVHEDLPFVQEVGIRLGELLDVRAVVLDHEGLCHVATPGGVVRWDGASWETVTTGLSGEVFDLAFTSAGELAVVAADGLSLGGAAVELPAGVAPAFVGARTAGGVWLGGGASAGFWDGSYTSIFEAVGEPVRAVVEPPEGGWLVATASGVVAESGAYTTVDGLPSDNVRSLTVSPEGVVWAGTDAGLAWRDATTGGWEPFDGDDGLHYGDVLRLAFDEAGTLLVATTMGGSAFYADGSRRYYFGGTWIPESEVRGMARAADGTVYLATSGGVSRVEQRSMTLAEKAAAFDTLTQERHVRLGYTATECHLQELGDLGTAYSVDNDNDGQWSAMYLASQCFRYAATGDPIAREHARVTAYALMKLEEVTEIPGFFARSIVPGDECGAKDEGSGEWHLGSDGVWCWKGDTSSDEFVGHMFGLSIFYDLAATPEEQADVAFTVSRILDYMIEGGFTLRDIDGLPTTHGNFDPEWMENNWGAVYGDAGLNSAMILGGLHAAYHMTGEARFREAFDYLAHERSYKDYVSRIEEINISVRINHDSEEMSFLAMYTLMRYENDPELLALWRQGLEGLWQVQRPERNPEFNMLYAGLMQTDEHDLEQSIETLQKIPLSLIMWGLDNTHRWDLDLNPRDDRFGDPQTLTVLPYDERMPERWAGNPYALIQGGNGRLEQSGTFWLLPYWTGRYYGIIR